MVTGVNSFSAQSYSNYISSGIGGKVYVPVKPSQVIFSQFEHVSGIANKSSDGGVPVTKIKILNTLIDQLIKFKSDVKKPELPTDLSDTQLDALIKDYQNQIESAVSLAKANPFGMTGMAPQTGMIFDMVA